MSADQHQKDGELKLRYRIAGTVLTAGVYLMMAFLVLCALGFLLALVTLVPEQ